MYKPFESLPKHSRIWIYQSNRVFSTQEKEEISHRLETFLNSWEAHKEPVEASFILKYGWFIVIAADHQKTKVSGCAIDAQVRIIQEFETQYNLTLLDKMNVTYKNGDQIEQFDLREIKKKIKSGLVNASTTVFNNLVLDIEAFEKDWEVPLEISWHSRYL